MKLPTRWTKYIAVLFLVFLPFMAFAHPHVFVDARVILELDDSHFRGFWAEWEFDRMFTAMIVMDFRVPREGAFSSQQIRAVEQGAFTNLQYYNYFTYIVHNGSRHPTNRVEEFTAFMRNGRIVYRFFVPYEVELTARNETLRIQMFDNTFFTDIAFQETDPVLSSNNSEIEKQIQVRRDRDRRIEFDAADTAGGREDVEYSGITYPYEVHLQLRRP